MKFRLVIFSCIFLGFSGKSALAFPLFVRGKPYLETKIVQFPSKKLLLGTLNDELGKPLINAPVWVLIPPKAIQSEPGNHMVLTCSQNNAQIVAGPQGSYGTTTDLTGAFCFELDATWRGDYKLWFDETSVWSSAELVREGSGFRIVSGSPSRLLFSTHPLWHLLSLFFVFFVFVRVFKPKLFFIFFSRETSQKRNLKKSWLTNNRGTKEEQICVSVKDLHTEEPVAGANVTFFNSSFVENPMTAAGVSDARGEVRLVESATSTSSYIVVDAPLYFTSGKLFVSKRALMVVNLLSFRRGMLNHILRLGEPLGMIDSKGPEPTPGEIARTADELHFRAIAQEIRLAERQVFAQREHSELGLIPRFEAAVERSCGRHPKHNFSLSCITWRCAASLVEQVERKFNLGAWRGRVFRDRRR